MRPKNLCYVVSSHYSYAPFALPRCLASLKRAGCPAANIIVVMGGCVKEFDVSTDQGTVWYVDHLSRNFNTFVELVSDRRRPTTDKFSHAFCMLDTCEVLPGFIERTHNFDESCDAVAVTEWNGGRAQCDLGAYSIEYLLANKAHIGTYKNADPGVNFDEEGMLYARAPRRAQYNGGGYMLLRDASDVYGTGSLRITELYPSVGLIKYKSNWGQNGRTLLERC